MENNNLNNLNNGQSEENNKKKFVIALILCLTLIIVIGGVSYAFMTYSRVGEKTNVIKTGDLEVEYIDGVEGIDIINAYPIRDDEYGGANGEYSYQFTVRGHITGNDVINYNVYAVEGDKACLGNDQEHWDCSYYTQNVSNYYRDRFHDYDMKMMLTGSTSGGSDTINLLNHSDKNILALEPNALANIDENNNVGLVIAKGTFTSETDKTHSYTLTLWISSDLVQIQNDRDTYEEYTASAVYTWGGVAYDHYTVTHYKSADYAKLYYSLKINVHAVA